MIIVMGRAATEKEVNAVVARIQREGWQAHPSAGATRTVIGVIGENTKARLSGLALEAMPGVEQVVPILNPFKLAGREIKEENSLVEVGGRVIGGSELQIIAGPCAVENREQIIEAAEAVRAAGATMLRGGAFKPRTSPYSFQGLEEKGLEYLAEAREKTGLPVVTEVIDPGTVPLVAAYADMLQVGARNMQNFVLLRELGHQKRPVLLKRGASSTIEEWLLAAEYIMSGGNPNVVLCERGIRTFETYTRNTLDLSAVPAAKHLSHLPVIADPSHGTGKWRLVSPMARAALAAGADGLMIEVHPNPSEALSDGPQSLTGEHFSLLINELRGIAGVMGKTLGVTEP